MKNHYFAIIASLLVLTASAQVPGYQGKKMSIGYDAGISIAASNINSSHNQTDFLNVLLGEGSSSTGNVNPVFIALNTTHAVNFNWVYSRRYSLLGMLCFMKSAALIPEYSGSYTDPNGYSVSYSAHDTTAHISGVGFLAGIKVYHNALAPLGGYWTYKVGLNFYSSNVPYIKSTVLNSSPYYYSDYIAVMGTKKVHNTNLRLIYGWGKQLVIKDKILFDTGFDWDMIGTLRGFLLRGKRNGVSSDSSTPGSDYEARNFYTIKSRTAMRDAFVFHLGLSYLL